MTHQEIARDAAIGIRDMERKANDVGCSVLHDLRDVEQAILTAAAKMVRESGLESALQQGIADMRFAHEAAEKKWNSEVLIAAGVGGARLEKALAKLRALTEAK